MQETAQIEAFLAKIGLFMSKMPSKNGLYDSEYSFCCRKYDVKL